MPLDKNSRLRTAIHKANTAISRDPTTILRETMDLRLLPRHIILLRIQVINIKARLVRED
jgi:ribonuclease PH